MKNNAIIHTRTEMEENPKSKDKEGSHRANGQPGLYYYIYIYILPNKLSDVVLIN